MILPRMRGPAKVISPERCDGMQVCSQQAAGLFSPADTMEAIKTICGNTIRSWINGYKNKISPGVPESPPRLLELVPRGTWEQGSRHWAGTRFATKTFGSMIHCWINGHGKPILENGRGKII